LEIGKEAAKGVAWPN